VEAEKMKSKISVALLGIAIFLMGGIAGAVSHYLYSEHQKIPNAPQIPTYQDILDGMAKELMLDDGQKETLKVIFDESRKLYFDLALEYRPHYEKIRNETDDKIKEMLRPDQRIRFEEFLRKVYTPPEPPPKENPKNN
jgi:uncharacterized membrane protein